MLKKIFLFLFFIFILLLSIIAYFYFATHNPRPTSLLNNTVSIRWDQYGVPHILAKNKDEDAFFALGYVHAHDRFWQMEFQRRVASGTLSEIFGSKTLDKDKFLRTFGFYRATQQSWNYLDARTKSIVQSYTAGVNAFLQTQHLPLEFLFLRYKPAPWTIIDSLCWEKMMAFDLQNQWENKIENYSLLQTLGEQHYREMVPPYPTWAPTVLSSADLTQSHLTQIDIPGTPENLQALHVATETLREELGLQSFAGKGSNAWVISGKISASGKPLLANDPHLSLQAPAVWYLAELQGPSIHLNGASIPGLPSIIIGHNDHIAWGVTNINPDTQDLYIEPKNIALSIRHETIKIKNEQPFDLPVYESMHGPIISTVSPKLKNFPLVALKWTALFPNDTTIQSLLGINYAKNWQEFTNALQYFVVPSQNFVYADTEGNIGYSASGLIPIRLGWTGEFPVMAAQQHEWAGFIPYDKLPQVYNPPEGFIVTANNAITSSAYPYALTFRWSDPGLRAKRITELLQNKTNITPQDFAKIQNDTYSTLWELLKPILLNTSPLDDASRKALSLLQQWQNDTQLDDKGATVFAAWYQSLMQMPTHAASFIHDWDEPIFIQQQLQTNGFFCQPDCKKYLSETLQTAAKQTQAWGKLHQASFTELGLGVAKTIGWIWNRKIATPGGLFTVNVGTYDQHFIQYKGASYRQIIDLSNLTQSQYVQTLGQSSNPFDSHYADLLLKWRNGEYINMQG